MAVFSALGALGPDSGAPSCGASVPRGGAPEPDDGSRSALALAPGPVGGPRGALGVHAPGVVCIESAEQLELLIKTNEQQLKPQALPRTEPQPKLQTGLQLKKGLDPQAAHVPGGGPCDAVALGPLIPGSGAWGSAGVLVAVFVGPHLSLLNVAVILVVLLVPLYVAAMVVVFLLNLAVVFMVLAMEFSLAVVIEMLLLVLMYLAAVVLDVASLNLAAVLLYLAATLETRWPVSVAPQQYLPLPRSFPRMLRRRMLCSVARASLYNMFLDQMVHIQLPSCSNAEDGHVQARGCMGELSVSLRSRQLGRSGIKKVPRTTFHVSSWELSRW